jgi:hypothetical protein
MCDAVENELIRGVCASLSSSKKSRVESTISAIWFASPSGGSHDLVIAS